MIGVMIFGIQIFAVMIFGIQIVVVMIFGIQMFVVMTYAILKCMECDIQYSEAWSDDIWFSMLGVKTFRIPKFGRLGSEIQCL